MTRPGASYPARHHVALGAVMLLLGAMFAVSAKTSDGSDLRDDSGDLARLVRQQDQRVSALQAGVAADRKQLRRLDAGRASGADATLQAELEGARTEAAQTPVAGPGLVVTLTDAPSSAQQLPDVTPDDLVIHQQDLEGVVNALWAGGAEAMMLADQRVDTTSAFRCVGNTLLLKGRVYSPPFVVKVIGSAPALRQALEASPDVEILLQWVDAVGLGYTVEEDGSLAFPGVDGGSEIRFARPVTKETK